MAQYKEFAQVLKQALGDRTQDWLQENSGVSQSTISRLLRGTHPPSIKNIKAIAKTLKINPNDLLLAAGIADGKDDESTLDPSAKYIARQITNLPDGVRERAIDAISGVVDSFSILAGSMEEAAQNFIEEQGVLTHDQEAERKLKILKRRDPELYEEIMREEG